MTTLPHLSSSKFFYEPQMLEGTLRPSTPTANGSAVAATSRLHPPSRAKLSIGSGNTSNRSSQWLFEV